MQYNFPNTQILRMSKQKLHFTWNHLWFDTLNERKMYSLSLACTPIWTARRVFLNLADPSMWHACFSPCFSHVRHTPPEDAVALPPYFYLSSISKASIPHQPVTVIPS